MSELHRRLDAATEHLVSRWNPQREAAAWIGMARQRKNVRRARGMTVGVAVFAAVALFLVWQRSSPGLVAVSVPASTSAATAPAQVTDFRVTPLARETRWSEIERSPSAVRVRLAQGAARFEVAPDRDRQFQVIAGEARVTVLGTIFSVELHQETVEVGVERGKVRLEWTDGSVVLGPGSRQVVPLRHGELAANTADRSGERTETQDAAARTAPDWRALAANGSYQEAYAALQVSGADGVRHEPEDLMLAADVARLGGDPRAAVHWLEEVVSSHRGDPRAALAAFTLGRVLLDQLGRPGQAAEAFARARRMAPTGALAEDALAREVEARARSGDEATARDRAREYIERYPSGRRSSMVIRHLDGAANTRVSP
ncbi:MAG: FecR domain-containing protein [Polyangiaceae bacterium]|nr:FecR domain-containing protein [Polyangiaceae bacterium]